MVVFRIREKFWGFGDNFAIQDESGKDCYKVKGKVFSWGDKLSFQDMEGNELTQIKQKMMNLLPKYHIIKDGEKIAEIYKKFTVFKDKFIMDVPGPNDYTISGSVWEHDFTFKRDGKAVATVSKKIFAWTDSYSVSIVDGEDVVAILCACIVVDQVLHDQKDAT